MTETMFKNLSRCNGESSIARRFDIAISPPASDIFSSCLQQSSARPGNAKKKHHAIGSNGMAMKILSCSAKPTTTDSLATSKLFQPVRLQIRFKTGLHKCGNGSKVGSCRSTRVLRSPKCRPLRATGGKIHAGTEHNQAAGQKQAETERREN